MRRRTGPPLIELRAVRRRDGAPRRSSAPAAFTLVELMIVIGILAMLVGLLMPSLGRARVIARQATCRGNLHSIGTAMATYRTEFNTFPNVYSDRGGAYLIGAAIRNPDFNLKGNSCNMFVLVRQDLIESTAFLCASAGHKKYLQENPALDDDFASFANVSYSMHVQRPEQSSNKETRALGLNPDSSMPIMADRTPLSGDTSWGEHSASGGWEAKPTLATVEGGITDSLGEDNRNKNSYNHEREGQNVLRVDASAAWSTTSNAGINGDNLWTWDDDTEIGSAGGRYGVQFRDTCAANRKDSFLFP